jgi:hypothetical protein
MSRTSSQGSGSFKEDEARIAGIVRAAERAHRRAASARAREVQALINFVAAKAGVPRPVRRATAPAAAAGNGSGKPKPAAAQRVPTRPQPAAQTPRAPQRAWSVDTLPPPETGAYEIVHELSHCGASVVYAARQAGGSDGSAAPKFAVKVTRPPGIWSADEARRHVHDFLAAAALQKRVADARPDPKGHWAPVHGEPTEIRGDGAWYATDRFDRSAEDLASLQRGSIAEGDLWRLVSGVIDGLEQLEQVAQRPHGNLKPGNVLVASRGRRFRAVLADPLADDESARHLGRAADLRQLGDLIRKLVLRDAGGTDAATASLLGAPTAWAHLGQFANQWREFCGALLEGGARYPTFDDLRAALRPLSPKVRVGKQMAVAAGAVLLVTGISVGVHLYNHRYQPAQWEALCDHWDWYHRAHDALKSDRGTLALDGPVESEPLSPWQIAGDDYKTSSMDDLRRLGRENTPKTLFRGKEDIRTSLRAVDALHERLLPKHWRFWAEVDGRIAGIEKAEPKFAEELRSYRQAVVHSIENEEASSPAPATAPQGQPAADRQLVWTQFDDLLRLGTPTRDQQGVAKPSVLARIETVNAQCDEIRKAATWKDGALEVTDAFLATVVRDIRADVNQRPVHRLGSADADAYELVTGTVLKDLHAAANGFYWKGIRDDEGHVDAEHLKQLTAYVPADAQYGQVVQDWVAHVGAYQVLVAIPRPDEWKQKHAPDKLIERLDAAEKGGAVDGDDELKGRIARLRDNIGRLRTLKEEIENHVYVKRESKLMVDRLAEIDKLQRDVEATLAKVVEDASVPLEWLANITKAQGPLNKALQPDRGFASPAVAEFWRQEKDRFVRELPAKHARSDEAKLFANVQLRLTRAARRLDENELPLPSADPAAPEWAKPFFAFAPERRGQLLKGLCDKVLADPRPMVDASDELIQQARRDWTDWQKAIADWVKVGTHLQDALAPAGGLYFVDDTPPGEPAPLGRQLEDWLNLAASDKDPLHLKASTACAKELAILRSSLERLKSLAAKDPAPAEVRGALTNPSAPAPERWAAWRAAGRLHGAQRLPLKDPAATQPSELTAR